ncbi:hypothetical protein Sango_0653900 [Sesamum angolense]|uniref:Retroviral polymerase SH3-like domain-containing protein n=1 Tax=Sesamum angolense TaxID=2727404 RepID=A0AAE2C2B3_9LAMI|nr:hypothetical protein Sango_0653900 [Sesamum angolense]
MLYGIPPSYEHLRTFGCLCFASNLDPQKFKFHKRAFKCMFLGYSMTQKAYRVYDLESQHTLTSRKLRNTVPFPDQRLTLNTVAWLPLFYELRWISCILKDFGISLAVPIPLICDNKAALHILANPVFHECTKHIELDCHLIRDGYKDDFIDLTHVRSTAQLNDLFTKVLPLKVFWFSALQVGTGVLRFQSHLWGAVGIHCVDTATLATIDAARPVNGGTC